MTDNVLPFPEPEPEKEPHPEKVPPPNLFGMWPASTFDSNFNFISDYAESLGRAVTAEFGDLTIGEAFEKVKDIPLKGLLENLFGDDGEAS